MNLHEDLGRKQEGRGSSDRGFGIVFAVFFALVALGPLRRQESPRWWALALGVVFLAIAWLRAGWLRPMNRVWTRLGLLLGQIVNPLVTGLLFYLVVTPMALLLRAMGKDPLRLATDPEAQSYWINRPPGPPPETMPNQF
jgi:hypothetical protein